MGGWEGLGVSRYRSEVSIGGRGKGGKHVRVRHYEFCSK